jgi:hypothetical protein
MRPVPGLHDELRPATDAQVALAAQLLAELNGRSFRQLRAAAAGSRPKPDPERLRTRLLALIEQFLADERLTPEGLRGHAPPGRATPLGNDLRGTGGQEVLRQIVTQVAALLLLPRWPGEFQTFFDGLRPRLLRWAPEIVPSFLATIAAVRASDFMASWGLAISEEHERRIEPAPRAQREAVEDGVRWLHARLGSDAPIDAIDLVDAALDDFEDLTRGLAEARERVVS